MPQDNTTGIWFIGARGGVASAAALGIAALAREITTHAGLVSTLPPFSQLDLVPWSQLVVGGHEIRGGSIAEAASALMAQIPSGSYSLVDDCRAELDAVDARIRPGTCVGCGTTISKMATLDGAPIAAPSARAAVDHITRDLESFAADHDCRSVLVVNLASTEPTAEIDNLPPSWSELQATLDDSADNRLPASCLYAIAALQLGMPYINFTPSVGSSVPAICELAEARGTCHAGRDGKTGETLLKTVLAPMFAARNLRVMSWVGHNIFGNLDGKVLDDPANKAAKITSKDRVLSGILGYDPQTHVSIEYIKSLGDWKTAWDHIHFQGFLGTPMTMQFTWQGCDSLLAAPLVLDLVRLVELAHRRGETGIASQFSAFFKSPLGCEEHDFFRQFTALRAWAQRAAGSS